ncbi:hypothetical protein EIP91_005927 [Steccherinum ochraceum]|uniref:Yeast cell wall synthesis Kre9/Knh1-like N-terminal domain-containing protein n=1 Tax=Steccherinum ochraceum TaxID=92696 RepID=A0A4R0RM71_9APHY|nr:hypothetical protein EIP91_005927 [Steccherinum ochraceum]
MRAATFASILSFAAAAFAFQVTSPTNATGWTTTGPNAVGWSRVDTDAQNFTIVLSNQQVNPPVQEVLLAQVDATKVNTINVNPPSGGWVAGKGYQVNLVKSPDELSTILAQSGQFSITAGTGSTFSSNIPSNTLTVPGSTPTNTAANQGASSNTNTAAGSSPSNTDSSDLNPSQTPTTPSGALPAFNMQAGVFAVLALLGSFLA